MRPIVRIEAMAATDPFLKPAESEVSKAHCKESERYLHDISPSIVDFAANIDFGKTPQLNISLDWCSYRSSVKRLLSAVRAEFLQQMPQRNTWETLKTALEDVKNKSKLMSAIQAIEYLNKICWHHESLTLALHELEPNEDTLGGSEAKQFAEEVKRRMASVILYMVLCAFPADEHMPQVDCWQFRRKPPPPTSDVDYGALDAMSRKNTDMDFEMEQPLHLGWFKEGFPVFNMLVQQCCKSVAGFPNREVVGVSKRTNDWWKIPRVVQDLSSIILRQWEDLTQSHLAILRDRLDRATTMQNKMVALSSTAFISLFQIGMRHFSQTQCE